MQCDAEQREVYLDNASTSYPKPEAVYRAVDEFARVCGASPGRGGHRRALEAAEVVASCRATVARILGTSDASRIAFASSSTEALNWALRGLLTKPGDHVVVTALEHNAVLRPLAALARQRGVTWTVAPCTPDGDVDPSEIERALRPETRLVCLVHASNVLGSILPVREIAAVARSHGVPVLVDGSQTLGAHPVAVDEESIDMFAFTGHKSLLGPPGTGGLYVREGLMIETSKEGGTGTRSESLVSPAEMPERLEVGTSNAWGIAGLLAGARAVLAAGVLAIRDRELALARSLVQGLDEISGVTVHGPRHTEKRIAVVSFTIRSLPPEEVGRLLGERYAIAVRTGLHCAPLVHESIGTSRTGGTVRFGIGPFNTMDDVERALEAVRDLAFAVFRRRKAS